MKIKKGMPILLTTAMIIQAIPVFANSTNEMKKNDTQYKVSDNKDKNTSKKQPIANLIGETKADTSELDVSEIRETLNLQSKSTMMKKIPIINGKNTSDILETKEKLDDIDKKKLEEKDKKIKTTSIVSFQDSIMYIKNGGIDRFVDGELLTTFIKTGTRLSYEDILQLEKTLDTDAEVTSIYYGLNNSKDMEELKPGRYITVEDGLKLVRFRKINEDKDSGNKDEPIKPYNPSNDPTNKPEKSENQSDKKDKPSTSNNTVEIGNRSYSLNNIDDYIKYLENLDKENKKKIKELSKKDKEELNKASEKGMKTFKGFEYYDNGSYKDVIAQKNLIVSMVNLLKTRVGILDNSQISFLGKKIDESKVILKESDLNKSKVEKYTDAFNKVRRFIEDNSDIKDANLRKIASNPINPVDIGERPAI